MSASLSLLYLSKNKRSTYSDAEEDYAKRISKYATFRSVYIAPIKNAHKLDKHTLLAKESDAFHKYLGDKTYLILLDENGKSYTSQSMSTLIGKTRMAHREIAFVIGGAFGFSDHMYNRANLKISLSPLTLPHEMARLVFIEQLYRSFTILNNEKYHHI